MRSDQLQNQRGQTPLIDADPHIQYPSDMQ